MKLIVTCGIRTLPGRGQSLADLYRDHLEEAVLAEELGFDSVWASEHHFSPDAWNPSPFVFLAAVAARTERVRLGTYVLLLPLHNPVRVAEDVAVLDNISRGRVDLAVGVGSARREFRDPRHPGRGAPRAHLRGPDGHRKMLRRRRVHPSGQILSVSRRCR